MVDLRMAARRIETYIDLYGIRLKELKYARGAEAYLCDLIHLSRQVTSPRGATAHLLKYSENSQQHEASSYIDTEDSTPKWLARFDYSLPHTVALVSAMYSNDNDSSKNMQKPNLPQKLTNQRDHLWKYYRNM